MDTKNKKVKTIHIRFASAIIGLILLQTVVFLTVILANNMVSSINRDSEEVLQQFASKRSISLQDEMIGSWSDIHDSAELANQIMTEMIDSRNMHVSEVFDDTALINAFMDDAAAELIDILNNNNVSGAFLLMCNHADKPDMDLEHQFQGIYFADSDPNVNHSDHSDIIMLKGNSTISSRYNIPLDVSWSSSFMRDANEISDLDFFSAPVTAAIENPDADFSELGCWSSHFTIMGSGNYENDLISYSVPLICDGQVYGVIGTSISAEHIVEKMPADELGSHGSYLLINSPDYNASESSFTAEVQAVSGSAVTGNIHPGTILRFSSVNNSEILHSIKNITISSTNVYCALDEMDLYQSAKEFYPENWMIISVVDEQSLFETSSLLTNNLILSTLISVGLCIVLAVVLTALVLKPVSLLTDDAESISETKAAPLRNSLGMEFNTISAALHELSTERNYCLKELKSEKERHLMLLFASDCHVFEYDRTEDTFIIYRLVNNSEKRSYHKNYRSLVTSGKVCAEEDIPLMLSFADGTAEEQIQMRIYEKNGELRWKRLISRPVYDADGNVVRVVACSFDITDEKLEEEHRLKRERLDKVTGFYSNEYGRMLIKKSIIENEGSDYNILVFSLRNVNNFIQYHGAYYFDGIIEEIGHILRMYSTPKDIIWRKSISDIAVYTNKPDKERFRSDVVNALDCISKLYCGSEDDNFICQVGISENTGDTPFSDALDKAVQAECAAEMPIYPDICYYSDINLDVNTRAALISSKYASSADHNTLNSGFIVTDNIISYTLNMLEQTKNIFDALQLIFCKAGYTLGFDRIAIYEINHDFLSVKIFCQWCRYEINKIEEKTFRMEKADFEQMLGLSNGNDIIFVDNFFDAKSAVTDNIINEFREDHRMLFVPAYDKGKIVGCVSYRIVDEEFRDEYLPVIQEISKIAATYFQKSKTSYESKAKSDFLSSMSHEIRTPMNAIMGMTAIAMRNDSLADDTRDCLSKIDSSAKYLLELINDILDMSRIESGKTTVEKAFLDINEIIEQADIINRNRIEEKGNRFIIHTDIEEPYLIGDSMKLKQVLVNILGNAAKFTENGSVTLNVTQQKKRNGDMTFVRFSIKDTGIGIDEENISRIFNSFEQAETSTARKYGGTGLGLSISRNYVQLMGGRLEVTSEVGKGSEFYFTLPMRCASEAEIPSEKNAADINTVDFSSKRVLLAEDDELNTEIARTLLEAEGLTVETAENGQAAYDMYSSAAAGYYDAILMDIRMPVMDGFEATKLIRCSDRADSSSVPIIAMTANAFGEDMKKSVECGMNGHISKPIDMNRIREVLTEIWSR